MASVKLQVVVDRGGLDKLQKDVMALSGKKISISVDTKGLTKLDEQTLKSLRSVTQYVNAVARAETQENKLKVAREKTAQATQLRITSENKLATQMEATNTASEKARAANINLQTQIEKTNTAQTKLAVQQEKTATAQENYRTQVEKTNTAQVNYNTQVEKTKTAQAGVQTEVQKTTRTQKENTEVTQKQTKAHESLIHSIGKFTQWYLIAGAVSSVTRAFTDAIATMKAVDDELVTVRKVTDLTASELEKVEKQAYKTASAYGFAADAYLNSVAEFARAGYGDQMEDLAELAIKTQLVGDVTGEVANQFLISVDAAYKFKGSVTELEKVLDGANEIDNKYATSIQKIAEGLGTVAPVAAQAHLGVDELTAAIGTITAVTQRSGSEAARALRALILNIIGDTKTEIEEGVTWTTGEIAGLREVLEKYAPAAVEAARATGEVINPMEAIAALADAMEKGLLTEQELMETVSDIGGKLRTSQLLALVQNWDMYQSMLVDYGNAIGSADREVENALDSWTRKTEVLKNTWTEFLTNFVNTDMVKDGIDALTQAIEFLDSEAGHAVITIAAFVAGAALIKKGFTGLADKIGKTTLATKGFTAALKANWVFLAVAGFGLILEVADALTTTYEEQVEIVEKLNSEYEQMFGAGSEYDTLKNKAGELTEQEQARLDVLEAQNRAMQEQLRLEKREEWESYKKTEGSGSKGQTPIGSHREGRTIVYDFLSQDVENLNKFNEALAKTEEQYKKGEISAEDYGKALDTILNENAENYNQLMKYKDWGFAKEFSQAELELIALYEQLAVKSNNYAKSQTDLQKAAQRLNEVTGGLIDKFYDTETGLYAVEDASGKVDKAFIQMVKDMIKAENTTLNFSQQKAAITELYKMLGGLSAVYNNSTVSNDQFKGMVQTLMAPVDKGGKGMSYEQAYAEAQKMWLEQAWKDIDKLYDSYFTPGPSGGNEEEEGGGGNNNSTTDARLESLKDIVSLRRSELSLLEAQGASDSARIAKMKEVQRALEAQASYMKSIGASQAEINGLLTEWYNIQNDIINIQIERLEKKRDEEISQVEAEIEALEKARDTEEERLTLEEKILAVQEKQVALANAQMERTVRYYNAQKGQWEWGANAKNVENAEKELADAKKELEDYKKEQAYEKQIAMLEDKIAQINKDYDRHIEQLRDQMSAASPNVSGSGGTTTTTPSQGSGTGGLKSLDEIAKEVYQGKWGNGEERKRRLREAGYDPAAVQKRVNELYYSGGGGEINPNTGAPVYDRGGILRGLGGIKATASDEIVLPPDITRRMISPDINETISNRFAELRYLYGASTNGNNSISSIDNRIGSQHNGDEYRFGDICISESQARSMSVYELAQLSRNLGLYNHSN